MLTRDPGLVVRFLCIYFKPHLFDTRISPTLPHRFRYIEQNPFHHIPYTSQPSLSLETNRNSPKHVCTHYPHSILSSSSSSYPTNHIPTLPKSAILPRQSHPIEFPNTFKTSVTAELLSTHMRCIHQSWFSFAYPSSIPLDVQNPREHLAA